MAEFSGTLKRETRDPKRMEEEEDKSWKLVENSVDACILDIPHHESPPDSSSLIDNKVCDLQQSELWFRVRRSTSAEGAYRKPERKDEDGAKDAQAIQIIEWCFAKEPTRSKTAAAPATAKGHPRQRQPTAKNRGNHRKDITGAHKHLAKPASQNSSPTMDFP